MDIIKDCENQKEYYGFLRKIVKGEDDVIKMFGDLLEELNGSSEVNEEQDLCEYLKTIHDLIYPLLLTFMTIVSEHLPEEMAEDFTNKKQGNRSVTDGYSTSVRRNELFQYICLARQCNREKFIRFIEAPINVIDDLLVASDNNDEQKFLEILKANKCDYSFLAAWLGIKDVQYCFHAKELIKKSLRILDNPNCDENEACEELDFYLTTVNETLPQELKLNEILKEDEEIDHKSVANKYFVLLAMLYENLEMNELEREILKPLLEGEEFKRLYSENEELIKRNSSIINDNEPERDGAAGINKIDFSSFDYIMDERQVVSDDEYIDVTNPDFCERTAISTIVKHIIANNNISAQDLPTFIYRLTGRRRPTTLSRTFCWNGEPGDLYAIFSRVHPRFCREKALKFITFSESENKGKTNRFLGKYMPRNSKIQNMLDQLSPSSTETARREKRNQRITSRQDSKTLKKNKVGK